MDFTRNVTFSALKRCSKWLPGQIESGEASDTIKIIPKTIGLRNDPAYLDPDSGMQKHTYSLSYFMVSETPMTRLRGIHTKRYMFCFKR